MEYLTKEQIEARGWKQWIEADNCILYSQDVFDMFYDFENRTLQIMKNWRGTKENVFKGICNTFLDLLTIEGYVLPSVNIFT